MSRITTKVNVRAENGDVVSQFLLGKGEHLIGRDQSCDIHIDDDAVSRQHAKLTISDDAIELEDLNSTSGTYLDGIAVKGRIPVKPGQKPHISNLFLDIEREGYRELVKGARLGEGRFTLTRKIGQGGMGEVWQAMDEQTGYPVALKLLPPEMGANVSALRDLERETVKTQNLKHPNILQIGGVWHSEREPAFLTLEYVDGSDLDDLRSNTPHKLLPWTSVKGYLLQICDALEYAHTQRIAHRDIKPSNLLVARSDQVKLADFGIAASIANTAGTLTTEVIGAGTPFFMSPQQAAGKSPQAADDIYSLGATLYDLLTGKPPFYQGEILHQTQNVEPTPINDRLNELGATNDIPDYVAMIVMSCLQKDPDKRPASMAVIRKYIESEGRKSRLDGEKRVVWGIEHQPATPAGPPDSRPAGHGVPPPARIQGHMWEVLCHVSALLVLVPHVQYGALIGPLVVWLIKRDSMPAVDRHGRASLNFQISIFIYWLIASWLQKHTGKIPGTLSFLKWIPWALTNGLHYLNLLCIIAAGLKAGRGEIFKYPLVIRFLGPKLKH